MGSLWSIFLVARLRDGVDSPRDRVWCNWGGTIHGILRKLLELTTLLRIVVEVLPTVVVVLSNVPGHDALYMLMSPLEMCSSQKVPQICRREKRNRKESPQICVYK